MKIKIFVLIIVACFLSDPYLYCQSVRQPSVAGAFYPSDSTELYSMVNFYIQNADPPEIEGTPLALIIPHAGFVYSGPTAGYGYNLLSKYDNIKTAIVIGFKHRVDYKGVAVWNKGLWHTPLGDVPIDETLANKILSKLNESTTNTLYFKGEHSLETQIPFLQVINDDISIVPIQIGWQNKTIIGGLTRALSEVLREESDFIIIASTDMSHYHSRADCQKLDNRAADVIENLDGMRVWNDAQRGIFELCGGAPLAVAWITASNLGADSVKILKMSDSGDFSGDTNQVVGYLSAVAYKSKNTNSHSSKESTDEKKQYISDEERQILLDIARKSIQAYLNSESLPDFDPPEGILTQDGAAFVTINKNSQLRGCIGYTQAMLPLYQTVSTCAIKAASEDPRFPILTKAEYPDIELEISVLTPLKKIDNTDIIEVGKHGLLIQKGSNRGLLLPQVATDYGWSREEFLNYTCRKAGLPQNCWKENCTIYTFTAEVFGEE